MSGPWGPTFDSQTLAAQRDYGSCLPAIEDGPRGLCVDLLTFTYHGGPRLPDNEILSNVVDGRGQAAFS